MDAPIDTTKPYRSAARPFDDPGDLPAAVVDGVALFLG